MTAKREVMESQKMKQNKNKGNKKTNRFVEDTTQSEKMRYKNADKVYE